VIVSYRSADTLRGCVAPLAAMPRVRVTVIDNASPDNSLATIADLEGVDAVSAPRNGGFAYGCNLGAARGSAPYLLFLNPDARLDAAAIEALAAVLDEHPRAALVGPKILDDDGSLAFSVRRFPRLRSTFGKALFMHRLFPLAPWVDELVRDPEAYERAGAPEWVSGACMLVRREVYDALGGFDEGMFLYCEDTDLCLRVWQAGHEVHFEPKAVVRHVGGHSSGAGETQAIAVQSRIYYARKHYRRPVAALERVGVALDEATHALAAFTRPANRHGHVRALRAALAPAHRAG
jgi:GT2 family glycosyltransferase